MHRCVRGCAVTCVYLVQAVAAKVKQLEVFGQQELLGPEMFDAVMGQIHLHYVRWQVRWDVIQNCRERKTENMSYSTFKRAGSRENE